MLMFSWSGQVLCSSFSYFTACKASFFSRIQIRRVCFSSGRIFIQLQLQCIRWGTAISEVCVVLLLFKPPNFVDLLRVAGLSLPVPVLIFLFLTLECRTNTLQSIEKSFYLCRQDRELLQKPNYDLQVFTQLTWIVGLLSEWSIFFSFIPQTRWFWGVHYELSWNNITMFFQLWFWNYKGSSFQAFRFPLLCTSCLLRLEWA